MSESVNLSDEMFHIRLMTHILVDFFFYQVTHLLVQERKNIHRIFII